MTTETFVIQFFLCFVFWILLCKWRDQIYCV